MTSFLIFCMSYDKKPGLDSGFLSLCTVDGGDGKTERIWNATSSVASKQDAESVHKSGGLLPAEYQIAGNLRAWTVSTTPIPMPKTKGVEGSFYQIFPSRVITTKGGERSNFGIHRDANVPGSMGCIVMDGIEFSKFEAEMKTLRNLHKITKMPLFVRYC